MAFTGSGMTKGKKLLVWLLIGASVLGAGGIATAAHFDVTAGEAGKTYNASYAQMAATINSFVSQLTEEQKANLLQDIIKELHNIKINKANMSVTLELKGGEDLTVRCASLEQWNMIEKSVNSFLDQCKAFEGRSGKGVRGEIITGEEGNPQTVYYVTKGQYTDLSKKEANVKGSFHQLTKSITALLYDIQALIEKKSPELSGTDQDGNKFIIPPREPGGDFEIVPKYSTTAVSSESETAPEVLSAIAMVARRADIEQRNNSNRDFLNKKQGLNKYGKDPRNL